MLRASWSALLSRWPKTSTPAFGAGIGVGVVVNNTDPVQQTLTLNSDYIVENLEFGGLWIEGVALSSANTTVKDNIGGQICPSADGTCPDYERSGVGAAAASSAP